MDQVLCRDGMLPLLSFYFPLSRVTVLYVVFLRPPLLSVANGPIG